MKHALLIGLLTLFPLGLLSGCGQGEPDGGDLDRMPPETREAELMDSSRLDPASPYDTFPVAPDTADRSSIE